MKQAIASLDFSQLSFLIIDDQPYSRRIVRTMLLGLGSREIHESANGAEALHAVRAARPSIIITDLVMPVVSGIRFISLMKTPPSPTHDIPIIVLSGYLTRTATLAVRSSGADEFLVKPVSPKALYDHISCIVLRNGWSDHAIGLSQQQKQRVELQRKKVNDLAYL